MFVKLLISQNVTCEMSNAYVVPWDMLNEFCFYGYAKISLFMPENVNDFFDLTTLSCDWANHRAGSKNNNWIVHEKVRIPRI